MSDNFKSNIAAVPVWTVHIEMLAVSVIDLTPVTYHMLLVASSFGENPVLFISMG
jgi:hypothetical protein